MCRRLPRSCRPRSCRPRSCLPRHRRRRRRHRWGRCHRPGRAAVRRWSGAEGREARGHRRTTGRLLHRSSRSCRTGCSSVRPNRRRRARREHLASSRPAPYRTRRPCRSAHPSEHRRPHWRRRSTAVRVAP
ncbi:hypothetical protein EF905_09625 [Streptomyces sp. WAC05374]|nr:hypothetical protein EF905_09625 [Streptomyces sp. WAC05374]